MNFRSKKLSSCENLQLFSIPLHCRNYYRPTHSPPNLVSIEQSTNRLAPQPIAQQAPFFTCLSQHPYGVTLVQSLLPLLPLLFQDSELVSQGSSINDSQEHCSPLTQGAQPLAPHRCLLVCRIGRCGGHQNHHWGPPPSRIENWGSSPSSILQPKSSNTFFSLQYKKCPNKH